MRKHFHLSPRNAADSSLSLVNDKKINDIISKSYKSLQHYHRDALNPNITCCFASKEADSLNIFKSKM